MAYLAVDKDGTEMISDYSLYRSGYYRKYKKCDPALCDKCVSNRVTCKVDRDGKRYSVRSYTSPPEMNRESEVIAHCDECGDNIYKDTLIID